MLNKLAQRPAQRGWPSHGLVSHWDMLEINGAAFHSAVSALAGLGCCPN